MRAPIATPAHLRRSFVRHLAPAAELAGVWVYAGLPIMRRLRLDLDWLVSTGLLLSAASTAVTGLAADLWDLNDFWYHTVAGYVMGGFAIVHVLLNWERLVGYARFRLRRQPQAAGRPAPTASHQRRPSFADPELMRSTDLLRRVALSHRGLLSLAAGGVGGWAIGRGLRPPPQIAAGSDVGVV
jgi:hypothetical protein